MSAALQTHQAEAASNEYWRGAPPFTIISDRLFAVGGMIPMDGRATWIPAGLTGFQPCNAFLLKGEIDIVVDPGPACIKDAVIAGLHKLMPPDTPVRLFLSRSQLDVIGNLGAVAVAFQVADVFTGGVTNPFDAFDSATLADPKSRAIGYGIARNLPNPPLEIFNTPLRMLATFWGYDPKTRTLFTSDSFTHATVADAGDPPIVQSLAEDRTTDALVRDHLLACNWWLAEAETAGIVKILHEFFAKHPVDVIAPDRGCVLKGQDVVRRHVDMVLAVLKDLERAKNE